MDEFKAKGNEAVKRGDFVEAVQFYKSAIEAGSSTAKQEESAALHSNCSFAYLKQGQLQEALEEANKSVALANNWSKAYFRRGEAFFALRDYAHAEEAYAKAAQLSSSEDTTISKKLELTREALTSGFYFRQLLAGQDFCLNPGNIIETQIFNAASQMKNYVYLVGDAKTREAVVVDAAWDVKGIRAFAAAENIKLVGAVVTHYHFDHTGGLPPPPFDQLGIKVPGVKELATEDNLPVYVNKCDAETVRTKNGVPANCTREVEDLSTLMVGSLKLEFLHTPGHTPGSQCIHMPSQDLLLSGDTLFIGSCGRLDLPDCDVKAMYTSLQKRLASMPDATRVYPGHNYGGPFTSIGNERRTGFLKPVSEKEWLKMHHRL